MHAVSHERADRIIDEAMPFELRDEPETAPDEEAAEANAGQVADWIDRELDELREAGRGAPRSP